jgi:hypothetical protein
MVVAIADARAARGSRVRMVSPRQAAIGAFIGGPVAFAYLIGRNYGAVGDRASATKMFAICGLMLLAWNIAIMLVVVIPQPILFALPLALTATPVALAIAASHIARQQIEALARGCDNCSSVHIAVSAVVGFVASIAFVLPSFFVIAAVTLGGFR